MAAVARKQTKTCEKQLDVSLNVVVFLSSKLPFWRSNILILVKVSRGWSNEGHARLRCILISFRLVDTPVVIFLLKSSRQPNSTQASTIESPNHCRRTSW